MRSVFVFKSKAQNALILYSAVDIWHNKAITKQKRS